MNLKQFVAELAERGVKLWVESDQLHIHAPKGVLTSELREELALHKAELLLLLQQSNVIARDTAIPQVPVSLRKNLPLSFAQEGLWFLSQLEPTNPFYNEPLALRLHGSLNLKALEKSLNNIIQRHEALRTNFTKVDGQPVQVIAETLNLSVPVVDLGELPEREREFALARLVTAQVQEPFDLTSSGLIQASLIRLTQTEHVLLLKIHHIVYDGHSQNILVRELAAFYSAFCHNLSLNLPSLPIQYAEFAVWQRQGSIKEVMEPQLAYWKQQLSGAPTLLDLPTDRPRTVTQAFRGAHYRETLSKDLTEGLTNLSQRSGVTLFMTLLAAFQTLLYHYTGQTDICVGTPYANRDRPELEGLIGLLVNTLVFRTDISSNPSFEELLVRVREVALGAYAHQDLPFEKLVEQLQPARSLSYTPLCQVMLGLYPPMPKIQMEGLTVSQVAVETATAKFDLSLDLENLPSGLMGEWEYNTDLFDASTIARMAKHFQTLLEGIIANPQQKISSLPLLTEPERHQLLNEWNNTTREYPTDKCIHQLFEEQVRRSPDAIAVVFEGEHLTYLELNQKANKVAHHLRTLGVGPEVLVGICVLRSPEMVVGLLGILKAGGAYVPLDPAYPSERLAYMLSDSQVKVLLTQRQLVDSLPNTRAQVICLDTDWELIGNHCEENPCTEVQASNLAYIIYTSGSTGSPKGVMIEHRSLVNFTQSSHSQYGISHSDRVLQFASVSFDVAIGEIYPCLTSGGTLVLRTDEILSSAAKFLWYCQEYQLTVLVLPTAYWHSLTSELADTQGILPLSVRLVIIGGEAGRVETLLLWQKYVDDRFCHNLVKPPLLVNAYGPSETTVDATILKLSEFVPHESRSLLPIGRPIDNVKAYILDRYLQAVPIGVRGELYIGGKSLARGYLNRPDLTAEKFIQSPFQKSERLYKTGDLACYLPDGNIEFLGRIDQQVKIRGFRIELGEIETIITQHSQVAEAVVVVNEDQLDNKRLVAYVVPTGELKLKEDLTHKIKAHLRQKLPEYMVPRTLMILTSLPLTPNGKVNHRALPAPDPVMGTLALEMPQTKVEKLIADIWQKILLLEKVGLDDNFFDLGGTSLRLVQVWDKLQIIFSQKISMLEMFQHPTVRALGQYLSGHKFQTPDALKLETERVELRNSSQSSMNQRRNIRRQYRSQNNTVNPEQ